MQNDRSKKLLMIGQAPSKNGNAIRPLEGRIGDLLADLAGITLGQYLACTERMNVLDRWPGRGGGKKGDAFPISAARASAAEKSVLLRNRRIIFVGAASARAFGRRSTAYLTWHESREDQSRFAVLPHLSGIVRWWNDPKNRQSAARFLRAAFAASKRGE